MAKTIHKILVVNRGEIAIRVIRTCREMGITSVAVFSEADKNALHVKEADEAIAIGGLQAAESYLNQDKIIMATVRSGADAIHPGYGFLAENASFAKKCDKEKIIFIGPHAKAIEAMGDKRRAKEIMEKHDVPVIPGYDGKDQTVETLSKEAKKIGFPVLLKASAGGGGKGMRIVNEAKSLKKEIEGAKREAQNAFGDDTLLIEKYFPKSRHIEFQIFGDRHGNAIQIFERECSIQRRYQKIIEESPSPAVDETLRGKMAAAALKAAEAIKYDNAGTVEFILDDKGKFYFLEVNTRLQVEHPVTEMITGLDLVRMQIEVAQGQPLSVKENDIKTCGHAIECRLYAEDPANNFLPVTGKIQRFLPYENDYTRYESGVESGSVIDIHYDPMIAKVVAHGKNRQEAINRMKRSLQKTVLLGPTSNKSFLIDVLGHDEFASGNFNTQFLNQHTELTGSREIKEDQLNELLIAACLWRWSQREENRERLKNLPSGWRNNFYQLQLEQFDWKGDELTVGYRSLKGGFQFEIAGKPYEVELIHLEQDSLVCQIEGYRKRFYLAEDEKDTIYIHTDAIGGVQLKVLPRFPETESEQAKGSYNAPMPGEVIKVLVKAGDKVKSGDGLVILSSMKMENTIEAFEDGKVEDIFVKEKDFVEADTALVKISK